MVVKVEVLNRQYRAKKILKALCSAPNAIETTPHFLVKHAFQIAEAFQDRIRTENAEPQNQV